ncbi:HTH-type transcriptional regulator CdhR [Pseudomonas paraeruginosa]|uniref:HTH-type transcriptional regulator CdhR n=1 Tax=Pseudomonas paraeruginosa TaxID=2994495 RepID=A0A2R3IMQ0_9PSED|nr:HTH-type transcriptional regulator CdhR [Pseudomonas paraeruginosa]AWE90794.1 HTH-type transcriptional regulator CdhR [Pseudomonas paraeruginosa]
MPAPPGAGPGDQGTQAAPRRNALRRPALALQRPDHCQARQACATHRLRNLDHGAPHVPGLLVPPAARLLGNGLRFRRGAIASGQPLPRRPLPLARAQRRRRPGAGQQWHVGEQRRRAGAAGEGRPAVRGGRFRAAAGGHSSAGTVAAQARPQRCDPRRHRYRQRGAGRGRAARRASRDPALGSHRRLPGVLPAVDRDPGTVRDRRPAHHLGRRHRLHRPDARPDRPGPRPAAGGAGFRAVRARPHPPAPGPPAPAGGDPLWGEQPQAGAGDRRDGAAYRAAADHPGAGRAYPGHPPPAGTAVPRAPGRHALELLPRPAPGQGPPVAAPDRP